MDLKRAYETLALGRDASAQEVEAVYTRLRTDYDGLVARASTAAIRRRYLTARAELDSAHEIALSALGLDGVASAAGDDDGGALALAHAVLGLQPTASPLDVASAYVSLCEELERELASVPTEVLRRHCLEARAEVDEAYRCCIAAPLGEARARQDDADGRYETQMASGTFEASEPSPSDLQPPPARAAEGTLVLSEDDPAPPRRRRGRGVVRFAASLAGVALLLGGSVFGFGWWTDTDIVAEIRALIPDPPDPRLVKAQGDAEYMRRRITEERRDIQSRADQTRERVARLESELLETRELRARERLRDELVRARARHALAVDLVALTEQHVFTSSDLAVAYGRIELGVELAQATHKKRALEAFGEAHQLLQTSIERLDEAEQALGARSEARASRDAWYGLQLSADLPDSQAATQGDELLAGAEALLEEGAFEDAVPGLRRASHLFRVARDDGRRAATRSTADSGALEAPAESPSPAGGENTVAREESPGTGGALPSVAAQPPDSHAARASIKLVAISAGDFLYGCRSDEDGDCEEAGGRGRPLNLPAFQIDRTEVRVDEYAACVRAAVCSAPDSGSSCNWDVSGRGDHPINCVDWKQARGYCSWVGKRLPSEREWEKAARGGDGRPFPWGEDVPSCENAVTAGSGGGGCGQGSTWPVGSLVSGRSPYGLFDMAGNVLEWTSDRSGEVGDWRVARGGSWLSAGLPLWHRQSLDPLLRDEALGFRCAGAETLADAL